MQHFWLQTLGRCGFSEQILPQIRAEPSSDARWCWLVDVASCDVVLKGNHQHHLFILLNKTGGRPAPVKTFKILPEMVRASRIMIVFFARDILPVVNKDSVSRTTTYSERIKTYISAAVVITDTTWAARVCVESLRVSLSVKFLTDVPNYHQIKVRRINGSFYFRFTLVCIACSPSVREGVL